MLLSYKILKSLYRKELKSGLTSFNLALSINHLKETYAPSEKTVNECHQEALDIEIFSQE
jgi:hypothetical protein